MSFSDEPDRPGRLEVYAYGGHVINVAARKEKGVIHGVAYCPLCQKLMEAADDGYGESFAINMAVGKVRSHMARLHGLEDMTGN